MLVTLFVWTWGFAVGDCVGLIGLLHLFSLDVCVVVNLLLFDGGFSYVFVVEIECVYAYAAGVVLCLDWCLCLYVVSWLVCCEFDLMLGCLFRFLDCLCWLRCWFWRFALHLWLVCFVVVLPCGFCLFIVTLSCLLCCLLVSCGWFTWFLLVVLSGVVVLVMRLL